MSLKKFNLDAYHWKLIEQIMYKLINIQKY